MSRFYTIVAFLCIGFFGLFTTEVSKDCKEIIFHDGYQRSYYVHLPKKLIGKISKDFNAADYLRNFLKAI